MQKNVNGCIMNYSWRNKMHFTKKTLAAFFSILSLTAILLFAKAKFDAKNYSPLALMTIITNSTINWENESLDLHIDSSNSTTQFFPIIEESVNKSLNDFGFNLIKKEDIINTPEYKNTPESKYYINEKYSAINDYRLIPEKNKAAIIIKEKNQAKAFAYITVFIEKTMAEGYNKNGTIKCKVSVFVDITNENGKLIASSNVSEYSDKVIQVVDGRYNQIQFSSLIPDTVRAAITNATAALK